MTKSKTCVGCKYAEWKKTKSGKLHPSGDGVCRYKVEIPAIPPSMRWMWGRLILIGWSIKRKEQLSIECIFFEGQQ